MNKLSDTVRILKSRLKAALNRIEELEYDERLVQSAKAHLYDLREWQQQVTKLKDSLHYWQRKYERGIKQLMAESEINLGEKDREIARLKKETERLLAENVLLKQANIELKKQGGINQKQILELEKQRNEAVNKANKLHAQINRDYENSSIPSSKQLCPKKKITNNRERSGRKPGAQPGHEGHTRKKPTVSIKTVKLPPPQEVFDDKAYRNTGKTIKKQLIEIGLLMNVTEYEADIYYNSATGERKHAAFPKNVVNDVNYGGTVKALLYMLNNECNVSIDKCRRFLYELTGGGLRISKGMISHLGKKFAEKSQGHLRKMFAEMLVSPVIHTDCTNVRVNGKTAYAYVCSTPKADVMYFARKHKGHDGVKGTVVEDYEGTLVHDHEMTFYSYGSKHQECNVHILRYLRDSMDNEPELTWNSEMRNFIQELIHYRNNLDPGSKPDKHRVAEFEKRYDEIIRKGEKEYETNPPKEFYRDGFNLLKRLKKFKKNHLLFLHDMNVPSDNNLSERLLRKFKRKMAQAISLRSFTSLEELCCGMSMLASIRQKSGANVFLECAELFNS